MTSGSSAASRPVLPSTGHGQLSSGGGPGTSSAINKHPEVFANLKQLLDVGCIMLVFNTRNYYHDFDVMSKTFTSEIRGVKSDIDTVKSEIREVKSGVRGLTCGVLAGLCATCFTGFYLAKRIG